MKSSSLVLVIALVSSAAVFEPVAAQRSRSPATADRVYETSEVTMPAKMLPESEQPSYPAIMRRAAIGGTVRVSFVVDTNGRADTTTFKVLESPHKRLSLAVKAALPGMRFTPATRQGRKVKQLIILPFSFKPPEE